MTTKTIATLKATNPDGDTLEIVCMQSEHGYTVYIDGGLLGDGESDANFSTLGRALTRMSDEAAACILGHYL